MAKTRNRKHGAAGTKVYGIWKTMKGRCHNPNHSRYAYYGGRGIEVCQRWRESFENFMTDMGPQPTPKHSVERRDNDKDYTPENCFWAPMRIQASHSSHCVYVDIGDQRFNLRQAAKFLGVADHYLTFYRLVRHFGFIPEVAATRILTGDLSKHSLRPKS